MSLRVLRGNTDGDMVQFILNPTPEDETAKIDWTEPTESTDGE